MDGQFCFIFSQEAGQTLVLETFIVILVLLVLVKVMPYCLSWSLLYAVKITLQKMSWPYFRCPNDLSLQYLKEPYDYPAIQYVISLYFIEVFLDLLPISLFPLFHVLATIFNLFNSCYPYNGEISKCFQQQVQQLMQFFIILQNFPSPQLPYWLFSFHQQHESFYLQNIAKFLFYCQGLIKNSRFDNDDRHLCTFQQFNL